MKRVLVAVVLAIGLGTACGRGGAGGLAMPTPSGGGAALADSMWQVADAAWRHGKWGALAEELERLNLAMPATDARQPRRHFLLGEAHLGLRDPLLAAREFRKVADETPNDPLAPEALLRAGDAFFSLWRRPELDPTYGQTALATYQELVSRYPGTPAAARAALRVAELNDRFAYKEFKAAQFYVKLRAWDSAILYLRDLVARYPRAEVAPQALIRLVQVYRRLGYEEDVLQTCGYILRFHPGAPGVTEACRVPDQPAG